MGAATIAILAERRHLENRAIVEARKVLQEAGCEVPLVVPDADRLFDIPSEAPPWDAVLSRGRDIAGLGLLSAAAALGVIAINTPRSIDLVRNKIAMQAVLLEHALPLPRTWFAADASVFKKIPAERYPLIVKPYDGDGSRGLSLLTEPSDVEELPILSGRQSLYLAQEYLETDGYDLKLYGIGAHVWAVRKPSPVSFPKAGPAIMKSSKGAERVELTAQLRDIALTCGRACGLEFWGVDAAITPKGPSVIEVNDFPTYSAVPEAGEEIAHYALTKVQMEGVARKVGRARLRATIRDFS
ncbi:MAG: ATP-grasp domain-containing protein [Actinomycetota bacterium]|nr:ATP-grasp domain-containing protein [Actinomycetota bacterium]